jgi:hypothetical protein
MAAMTPLQLAQAGEIAAQIERGVKMRLGYREPVAGLDGRGNPYLQFRAGPGRPHRKFRVTLEPSDTYRVQVFKIKGVDVLTLADTPDVYADGLNGLLVRLEAEHLST